jgi:hypothetical protein
MHVPFWECLRDLFHWAQFDKEKVFSSEALNPHLSACPYLNFTFCVKFSKRNNFNMYLPAEIRATNICACDLNMRLDFSQLLQQWVFSCPHYHQQGAPIKCVRRVLAQDTRYRLMENSPNLHGGAPVPINMQTVAEDDKKVSDGPPPVVHLPSLDPASIREDRQKEVGDLEATDDIFKSLYRTTTLNSAGSKEWLGETPTDESVAAWQRQRDEWERDKQEQIDRMREQYLHLEKMLDDALCQKIKEEETRKREDAKTRAKSNNVACLGCTEELPMSVFIPCYHMVMCIKCADKSTPLSHSCTLAHG